jgi:hypothetical protein
MIDFKFDFKKERNPSCNIFCFMKLFKLCQFIYKHELVLTNIMITSMNGQHKRVNIKSSPA